MHLPRLSDISATAGATCSLFVAILALVAAACSTDLGADQKRFACDSTDECLDGFVCRPVDGAVEKECVPTKSAADAEDDASRTDSEIDTGPDLRCGEGCVDEKIGEEACCDGNRSCTCDIIQERDCACDGDACVCQQGDLTHKVQDGTCEECVSEGDECGATCNDGMCGPVDGSTGEAEVCDDNRDNDCDNKIDCDDPDCADTEACSSQFSHTIFVTSTAHPGNEYTTPDAVDELCAQLGESVSASMWKAVIPSLGSTAADSTRERIEVRGSVVNINNELVATDDDDLFDGSIASSVRFTENSNEINKPVWTFSDEFGQPSSCDGEPDQSQVRVGYTQAKGSAWLNDGCKPITESAHYYCISQ